MANIEKLIENLENLNENDNNFVKICQNIGQDISRKELKIVDVVTKLQHLLVNNVPEKRAKGTCILSSILSDIDINFFTTEELQFITSFYADRLKDHHSVIPAVLKGILAISRMKNIDDKSVHTLLMSLFDNVSCPQLKISERLLYYEILKEFSTIYQTAIVNMHQQYLLGFIQSMDGERDPTCLLFLFTWIPQLLKFLPVSESLVEELFDVISCYFPIDFRTPPELSGRKFITREELALNLNKCLCAIPAFDQFCLPLILEKLGSALDIAKLDSLDLLANTCEVFKPLIYETFSQDIWSNLEKEILKGSTVKDHCLKAVTAVVKNMAESENTEILPKICCNIYDTSCGNLRPDAELFSNTCALLLAIARGSKQTCKEVSAIVLPLFLNQYNLQTNVKYQLKIFTNLLEYVKVYIDMFEISDLNQAEILLEIPILCIQTLQNSDPSIKQVGIKNIPAFFNIWPQNLHEAFYIMFKKILAQPETDCVRNEILNCLNLISDQCSQEIIEQIILKDENFNSNELQYYFDSLKVLAPKQQFTEVVLKEIVTECQNENKIHSFIGFSTVYHLLKTNLEHSELILTLHNNFNIIDKIFYSNSENESLELLKFQSGIISIIIQKLDLSQQNKIVSEYVLPLIKKLGDEKDNESKKNILILEGLVINLRSEVQISNKFEMLKTLLGYSRKLELQVFNFVCHIFANVINKAQEDDNFISTLNEISSHIDLLLDENNKINALNLHAWVTKSLLMRGSNHAQHFLDKLVVLLEEHDEMALNFGLVIDDTIPCLGRNTHCQIRLFYRQQFFNYVTKKFDESVKDMNSNYLLALGYILQKTSIQILKVHLTQVLRLMVMCLKTCVQPETLISVLETLQILFSEKFVELEQHFDSLIEDFLRLSTFKTSLKVRLGALICLQLLINNYQTHKLTPYQKQITFGLVPCMDDAKRMVRKQAVATRSAWILLGNNA